MCAERAMNNSLKSTLDSEMGPRSHFLVHLLCQQHIFEHLRIHTLSPLSLSLSLSLSPSLSFSSFSFSLSFYHFLLLSSLPFLCFLSPCFPLFLFASLCPSLPVNHSFFLSLSLFFLFFFLCLPIIFSTLLLFCLYLCFSLSLSSNPSLFLVLSNIFWPNISHGVSL